MQYLKKRHIMNQQSQSGSASVMKSILTRIQGRIIFEIILRRLEVSKSKFFISLV